MKVVLDTLAVVHLVERKHAGVVAALGNASEAPAISAVTLGELAVGWASLPADSPRRRTYNAARRLKVVNIVADGLDPEPSGLIAAFGLCRAAKIKGNDAWIAATAQATGATLVTFDETLAFRYKPIGSVVLLAPATTVPVPSDSSQNTVGWAPPGVPRLSR